VPIDYSAFRWPKGTPRIVDRILQQKRDLARQEAACRKHVKKRDDQTCRACGRFGNHLHHIVRRSRGGRWRPDNVVLTCKMCHQFEHAALLRIRGNPEPGELLTIVGTGEAARHLETGPAWRC